MNKLPAGKMNKDLNILSEYELDWPEFRKKCTCGARITYGQDTILHSLWCDSYEDKYEKKTSQNDTE